MHRNPKTVHLWKYVTVCMHIVLLVVVLGDNISIFSINCCVINIDCILSILVSLLSQIDSFANNML